MANPTPHRPTWTRALAFVLGMGLAMSGCRSAAAPPASGAATPDAAPRVVQPGAPGEASRVVTDAAAIDTSFPHTEADARFMQGMIHHHAQAILMTELARTRAGSQDIRRLALRITLSQDDEIAIMQRWLEERGEEVPEVSLEHVHHMSGGEHEFMPGMLTHEQMHRLESASGAEFDRLFLELMIQHHEGALIMVAELFAEEGAAYETEIHQFASHVEADQSIEIRRMRAMLEALR
jgi:uncharacterized protein (DUF305 family)